MLGTIMKVHAVFNQITTVLRVRVRVRVRVMYAKVSLMPQTVEKLTTKNGSSYNVLLSILVIP